MIRAVLLRSPRGVRVLVAGGIVGLREDGPAIAKELERGPWDRILLGLPFEDLDAVRATSGRERDHAFERDDMDETYVRVLGRFGPTEVPPPDLYTAFAYAERQRIPVDAIDLGDEGHSESFTRHVGMFELLRHNRRLRQVGDASFQARTAEAFVQEWDQAMHPTKGLRQVQEEREAWMASRIAETAQRGTRHFALIPLPRWDGVRSRLVSREGFQEESPPAPNG